MIVAFILALIAFYFNKTIRKYEIWFYLLSLVLIGLLVTFDMADLLGQLAMGFMLTVMFASLLKNTLGKRLMSLRKHYAIIGTLFGLAHGLYFVFEQNIELAGLISLVFMIPLAITSIMWIRKRMQPKTWKKLHKLSYVVYLGLMLHMVLLGEFVYIIFMILYIYLRFKPLFIKSLKTT